MSDYAQTRREQFQRRYREHDLPWDDPLPPPEILALIDTLPAGQALDLGCGSGRACVALAQAGWQVDGIDYVDEAIALAHTRVQAAGVAAQVRLHNASVAALDMLSGPYDLAIDVGCLHGLRGADRSGYCTHLARLLRPGGLFALYVHLRAADDPPDAPTGILREELLALFADTFRVSRIVEGVSRVAEMQRASLWCYFRREES